MSHWKTTFCTVAIASFAWIGSARADEPGPDYPHAKHSVISKKTPKVTRRSAKHRGPVYAGRLARPDELRSVPPEKPSGTLKMFAVNFNESLDVNIYNDDGSFNEEALDQLNHIFRCKRTGTEKAIDPRLFEQLSRIYDHFGERLQLISGFRNQERTSSYHFNGSASDIHIPNVDNKELHAYVASLDSGGMGLGIYPRAGFIHVDVRPDQSFRWVDNSPPGTSNMGHPHRKLARPSKHINKSHLYSQAD